MAGTVKLEKLGIPGVFMNCDTFDDDAKSAAADNGMPDFRRRKISSAEFYKVRGSVESIRPLVEKVFDELIEALVTPLSPEETSPAPQPPDTDGLPELFISVILMKRLTRTSTRAILASNGVTGCPCPRPRQNGSSGCFRARGVRRRK